MSNLGTSWDKYMSPVSPVFHTAVTVNLTLLRPSLILGEQDWDRASFQIGESDLIKLTTEGRPWHASGSAHYNIKSVTYIDLSKSFKNSLIMEIFD